jgi:hypothetical protein
MKQSCEEPTLVLAGIAEVLSDSPACLRLPLEVGTDHRLVLATDRCRRCRSVRDMEKGKRMAESGESSAFDKSNISKTYVL